MNLTLGHDTTQVTDAILQQRIDLAAVLRWSARLGYQEATSNHFSVAVSPDGKRFLLNPNGRFWARTRASDMILLDSDDEAVFDQLDAPDPTAWYLHLYLHAHIPHARCVLHTHMPYATALCCLQEYELQMIDQNACRFFGRILYDRHFGGMAFREESERLAAMITPNTSIVFMGNHGVLVLGNTIAQAFDELYYLEMTCRVQVLALSTQQPLSVLPDDVAQKTCDEWKDYSQSGIFHLREIKAALDREEPEYKL